MASSPDAGPSLTLDQALARAFAYLNRRERTIQEMRDHLLACGAPLQIVEAALRKLGEQGYLDDIRFARLFVQDKRNLNGWGSERIRQALLERRISREATEAALAQSSGAGGDEGDSHHSGELQQALELLARRFPDGLHARPDSDRALGMLLRKGYDYEVAVDALAAHRRLGSPAA